MRVPNASRLLYSLLVLALPTPIWAQPAIAVPSQMLASLGDQMASARLAELERIQASILSEPWSAETASRLRTFKDMLHEFNAPGHERRVSLLWSRCNATRETWMAKIDDDEAQKGHEAYWHAYPPDEQSQQKGTESYWPVFHKDNDDVLPPKGEKSYWGAYEPDAEDQGQKGNQSYWGIFSCDDDPPPAGADQGTKGTMSYWDLEDRL
jgi:hypothetical protein